MSNREKETNKEGEHMKTIIYKLVNPICKIIQETNTESAEDVIKLQMLLIVHNDVIDTAYEEELINLEEWEKLFYTNMDTIKHISETLYCRTYNVEDLCYHYKQLFK